MTLIGRMFFAGCLMPLTIVRKERVGMGRCVVYLRQTESVGLGKGLLIHRGPTDDIHFFVGTAVCQGVIEGWEHLTAR